MKKKITLISLFATILLFSSCESVGPGAQRGVAAGAATGAILGGIIGHQSGEGGEGAALGAATGAVLGGLLGNASDKENATREAKAAYRARENAQLRKQQADAERRRLISLGRSVEDPEVLEARQRAEAAEAEATRLLKEQEDAIRRANQLKEFQERERRAQDEARRLREGL
ncbi:MAG: hypothetical protein HOD72_10080 [Opitutae bacterium]|nr:hypothetical protein [Opitutae bacterium]MBT7853943.1 hypothetical protein [Opitutae bacterium]